MMNQSNFGIYCGRLATEPVFFQTAGGGEIAILRVGCRRNFTKGQDEPESDFAEFRGFIPKNTVGHGVYSYIHTGDLVSIQYSLRTGVTEKDGERHYYQSCTIENLEIKEGKTVRQERFQARQAGQENPSTKKRKVG